MKRRASIRSRFAPIVTKVISGVRPSKDGTHAFKVRGRHVSDFCASLCLGVFFLLVASTSCMPTDMAAANSSTSASPSTFRQRDCVTGERCQHRIVTNWAVRTNGEVSGTDS